MKCMNKNYLSQLAAGIFLLGQTMGTGAWAAPVTLVGNTVDFSFDDTLLNLFGPAKISGDTLYFTPGAFKAQSLNGGGFALTSSTINLKITPHNGWDFNHVDLVERGDYLLLGAGSTADIGGQMRVFDVATPLTENVASITSLSALNMPGLPMHNWNAQASVNLSAWTHAQAINVTVENLLLASTGVASSLAFVEKKFVGLTPFTVAAAPVPEAETYAMMLIGLGLVGFAALRQRKRSQSVL